MTAHGHHPKEHMQWLKAFVADRKAATSRDPAPLDLKLQHTAQVLANIRHIAKEEQFASDLAHTAWLAAIYHDLARFDQYVQYGTFKDALSRNHGLWAVELLIKLDRLAGETARARRTICTAIAVHNRLSLPQGLAGDSLPVANALRDADKLDILRVMDEHLRGPGPYNPTVVLSLPDDPDLHSPQIIADALAGKPASYADLRSVNDFRVLLGTWLFGMTTPTSRRMFAQNGHAKTLLAALPERGPYAEVRAMILDKLSVIC